MSRLLRALATSMVAVVVLTSLMVLPAVPAAASGWPIAVGDTSIGRPGSIRTHPDGRTYVCNYLEGTRDLLALEEDGSVLLDQPDESAALDLCRRYSRPVNNIDADGTVYGVKYGAYEPTLVVAYDGATEVWSQQIPGECSWANGGTTGPFVNSEGEVYLAFGACGKTMLAQFNGETGQVVSTHTLDNSLSNVDQVRQYTDGVVHQTGWGTNTRFTFYPFSDPENPEVYEPTLGSGDILAYWRVDPSGELFYSIARNDTDCDNQAVSRIVAYDGSETMYDIEASCMLGISSLEVTPNGAVLLGATSYSGSGSSIILIDTTGSYRVELPSLPGVTRQGRPYRLQVDVHGHILVTRPYEVRIEGNNYDHAEFLLFDANGTLQNRTSTEVIEPEADHNVKDMDLQNGFVYVLTSGSYSLEHTLHKLPFAPVSFDYVRSSLRGLNAESLRYVALGDSFSSGEGVEPFLNGTLTIPEKCHRSRLAYSRLLAADPSLPWVMADGDFVACSGAEIPDVVTSGQHQGMPRQLDALDADVDIVTISIGGNDVGFGDFAETCVLDICAIGTDIHAQTVDNINSQLVGAHGLESVYEQILSAAPNATLYVIDYPHVTPFDGHPATTRCPYLSASLGADARAAHDVTARISSAIETAVWNVQQGSQNSERIHFVTANGVNSPFEGHDVCSSDSYFHGVSIPNLVYSFHPNQQGQRAYRDVVEDYLN